MAPECLVPDVVGWEMLTDTDGRSRLSKLRLRHGRLLPRRQAAPSASFSLSFRSFFFLAEATPTFFLHPYLVTSIIDWIIHCRLSSRRSIFGLFYTYIHD